MLHAVYHNIFLGKIIFLTALLTGAKRELRFFLLYIFAPKPSLRAPGYTDHLITKLKLLDFILEIGNDEEMWWVLGFTTLSTIFQLYQAAIVYTCMHVHRLDFTDIPYWTYRATSHFQMPPSNQGSMVFLY